MFGAGGPELKLTFLPSDCARVGSACYKGCPAWLPDVNLRGSISCEKRFMSTSKQQLFFKVDSVDSILKRHH